MAMDRDAAGRQAPKVAVLVEAGDWPPLAALERRAAELVRAVAARAAADLPGNSEVSLVFTDDRHIAALNAAWRGRMGPTNVLSFPAPPLPVETGEPRILGDIVIAEETLRREADEQAKGFDDHLAHMIVHGMLHLLGHDHGDDREAERMEALERLVLSDLAIPDPYA